MDKNIKYRVFDWILLKMDRGESYFDVSDCIKDIGLKTDDKTNVEYVNAILKWNEINLKDYMINNIFEFNN